MIILAINMNHNMKKSRIAADKWRHFYFAIPMGIVFQALAAWWYDGPLLHSFLLAFGAVVAISYGFELFSKITGMGIYDFMDAVASIIGGAVGIGVVLLIIRIFQL
jgi:hypothetical protein